MTRGSTKVKVKVSTKSYVQFVLAWLTTRFVGNSVNTKPKATTDNASAGANANANARAAAVEAGGIGIGVGVTFGEALPLSSLPSSFDFLELLDTWGRSRYKHR